jgi:UDP-N-acetylglucosamine--N-acetylmuramyl-(pentapeptide) pyrophosphoryl-undecaprenol N-acetylglucosamine transferase
MVAGGTGGHLFPAEALGACLIKRGYRVALMTDKRALAFNSLFPQEDMHIIESATPVTRGVWSKFKALVALGRGFMRSKYLLRQLKPICVVGFGGYPTVPPLVAAAHLKIPTVLHEQNAVMGRANRFLSSGIDAIATCFPQVQGIKPAWQDKTRMTGNPLRPKVLAAIAPYQAPDEGGDLRVLVTGGSLGARVMSDIVPEAIAALDAGLRQRLYVIQQARPEDLERCRTLYAQSGVKVELASFFADLPAHMAWAHLVIGRAGASTVAELAALGRPSLLVPLPHALDQDQAANAAFLAKAGAADVIAQQDFTAAWLTDWLSKRFTNPTALKQSADAAKALAITDAAEQFAAFVLEIAHQERY